MTKVNLPPNRADYPLGFFNAQWWGARDYQKQIYKISRIEVPFTDADKIYHYTNLSGFRGIIESRGLWASHIRYMNDSTEFYHGKKIAILELQKFAANQQYCFFRKIIEGVLLKFDSNVIPNYYITCFSRCGDSLDQWRGYCNEGGVSIEFAHHHQPPFTLIPVVILSNVIYDDKTKIKLISLTIKRFIYEYRLDKKYYGSNFQSYLRTAESEYVDYLHTCLYNKFLMFKDPSFSSEKELRMIFFEDNGKNFYRKHHRTYRNFIIPYYTTADIIHKDKDGNDIPPEKLPITAIRIGPSEHQNLTAISIKEYLDYNGYADVKIELSKVPYRST